MTGVGSATPVPVLVVEDDPADVRLIRAAIADGPVSYDPHVARDGVEALEYLRSHRGTGDPKRPQFVLLDLNLPKMRGEELITRLSADGELSNLRVVLMSSSPLEAWPEIGGGAVVVDRFRKPTNYHDLRTELRRLDRLVESAGDP